MSAAVKAGPEPAQGLLAGKVAHPLPLVVLVTLPETCSDLSRCTTIKAATFQWVVLLHHRSHSRANTAKMQSPVRHEQGT